VARHASVQADPGDPRTRWQVADVLAAQQRAVGQEGGVDDVAVLRPRYNRGPGGSSIRGPVHARLQVRVAEEGPERVSGRVGDQPMAVAMTLEQATDGPGRASVHRLPEADEGIARGEDLVLEEVRRLVQLGEAVRRQRSVRSEREHFRPGRATV